MSIRSHSQAQTTSETSQTSVTSELLQRPHQQQTEVVNQQQELDSQTSQESGVHWNFIGVPVRNTSLPIIQPKLNIGQPGNRYEQEADRVAQQVMQMPHPMSMSGRRIKPSPVVPYYIQQEANRELLIGNREQAIGDRELLIGNREQGIGNREEETIQAKSLPDFSIQRLTPEYGEKLQRQEGEKEEDEDEETIQPKATSSKTPRVTPTVENHLHASKRSGQPLPDSTRAFMEPRFGTDFSGVRVHTDSSAIQMNQELRSQAFTHGNDIYYGAGKYPGNDELTAHELTHTIQQTGGIQAKVIDKLAKKANKVENKAGFAIQMKVMPGNEVNKTSPALVKNTEQKQQAEAENPPKTEVVAPQEPAETTAETPPQSETNTTSAAVEEKPEQKQEETTPEAGNEKVDTGVNQESASTSKETTPQETAPISPESDPDFQAVVAKTKGVAKQEKKHATADTKAKEAQDAAESPANEIESKAQANQVGEMEQAPTPGFNAAAFKAKLMEQITQAAPKTLEEADEFKNNNKLGSVKNQMQDTVKQEQTASQTPLEEKAQAAPDTSVIEPKSVTPLPANEAGAEPANIGAEKAVPKAKGQGEVEAPLQESSQKLDQQMAEADVSEEQLAKSNEPQFQTALDAKTEAQTNANQAPQEYRQFEQNQLNQAQGEATATAGEKLQGMHGDRTQLLSQVTNQQVEAKGKDEQERAKVAGDIQGIYNQTKTQVETILNSLDTQVEQAFDNGAADAQKAFEDYVGEQMGVYKDERYSGIIGKGRWVKDKILGLPSEVNVFYQEGRQLYLEKMDVVLDEIVNIIGTGLTDAKAEIAKGRQEIQKYVAELPEHLQKVGTDAATDIQTQFDELEQSVDSKQDELINSLAQKYNEKLQAVDSRIDEMKAANQGLVDKAANAIIGVINTIKKLKEMLLSVLSKAAAVIGNIIKDPIGFLGNLIKGIKQGFENFVANIGKHLQAGLIGWLTGTLGPMGIQLPDDIFSLPGIFSLVTQILGLTFNHIRGKAVKQFGEPVVAGMEQSVEIFQILRERGAMGLWEHVKEQFNDLKETVIEQIKSMVITQVITAGVKWIIGLLNPASAFVKAAMAIYDIIMFFVNRGRQVLELVNAIVDAVAAIASGAVGGAAQLVENALAKAVPVAIGFLASLLGIGGLAKKVEGIISKIRSRIDGAIDKVLLKAKKLFKKTVKKGKEKVTSLVEWWKSKKKFKTKDGESHTLSFKGQKSSSKLMIASTPKVLDSYLSELKAKNAKLSDDKVKVDNNKKIESIEVSATKIDKLKSDKSIGKGVGAEISEELGKIATNLAGIQVLNAGIPPSKVQWTQQGEDGKSMKAEPLSLDPGGLQGSEPHEESALWKKVSVRNTAKTTIYIRGHLLNHHVHGSGTKKNLTPITGALNSKMEREVESVVKNKVLGEKKVVSYEVEAKYGGHSGRVNIPEEANLATSLTFKLSEMEVESGKDPKQPSSWKKTNKISVPSSMTHVLPPDLPVGKLPSVDFGNAPLSDIVENLTETGGIGEKPAKAISDLIDKNRQIGRNDVDEKDLMNVPAVGKAKIEKIKETVINIKKRKPEKSVINKEKKRKLT
ncbi:MAG: DUF4157 domain-containing protein [Nostocaceae cyanobacterium]|nr:DUF4157 domain-containing protein [Nostocaceae cyanobacterium]